jgi:hypothetical protein
LANEKAYIFWRSIYLQFAWCLVNARMRFGTKWRDTDGAWPPLDWLWYFKVNAWWGTLFVLFSEPLILVKEIGV